LRIQLSNVSLNVEEYNRNSSANDYIFFLHGFTGSSRDWIDIIPSLNNKYNIIAIDLIGHGKSDLPAEISFYSAESIAEQIRQVILYYTSSPVIVAGYSMGSRAALSFASEHPQMLKRLILESTSAGIMDETLRNERADQDEKLAEFILSHTLEEFIDYWMNISLFDSQKKLPERNLNKIRESKLKNSKTGLANCLRGFSPGIMPPLFNSLKNITAKTLLISGELDSKYTSINKQLVTVFPNAVHIYVENAGHNVHLEQPLSYIDVINDFLNQF
jgi:2-succinyl-6-hydroxy-2,4-cyclohexadiene-1-carboxylate synthase